jgi:P-type Cu2+ transporter
MINAPMPHSVTCTHCGAPVPPGLVVPQAEQQFCCNGCRSVWQILHEVDAGDFYRLRDQAGIARPEACTVPELDEASLAATAAYADSAFIERHVRLQADGSARIDWYLAGVHCAACVWLLERLPELMRRQHRSGVVSARLDFGRSKLSVHYQPAQIDPAGIATAILQLGYQPHPWLGGDRDAQARAAGRDLLQRALVAAGSAAATMHLSLYLIGGELTGDQDTTTSQFFGWISSLLALPALVYSATPYYRAALAAARLRRISIDSNISLVVLSGYILSLIQLLRGSTALYFDAVSMFVCFLLLARLALHWARERVTRNLDAMQHLLPRQARRLRHAHDEVGELIAASDLNAGDTVLVAAGDQLPCDGTVLHQPLWLDASLLSGESRPVCVEPGNLAYAGSICRNPRGRLAVQAAGTETRMGQLLQAVQSRSIDEPHGHLIGLLQAWFAPLVLVLAIATALLWWSIDPSRMVDQVIALILACCPCALGLATPLAYAVATGRALGHGLLVRDAGAFERLAHIRHAVIDKTGTLTEGRMQVETWETLDEPPEQLAEALLAACQHSDHPTAQAVARYLHADDRRAASITEFQQHGGLGLSCRWQGQELRLGRPDWCGLSEQPGPHTELGLSWGGRTFARIRLTDPIRPLAGQLLEQLRPQAEIHLYSGDGQGVTEAVARHLAIDQAHGRQSPEAKAAAVTRLHQLGPVLVMGDGINDAPALAAADVAIGLRGGLQAAMDCADVFVEQGDIQAVGRLLNGARSTRRLIVICLLSSLVYNLAAVLLVMAGIWGPLICAVAMPISSLTVVALASLAGHGFDQSIANNK